LIVGYRMARIRGFISTEPLVCCVGAAGTLKLLRSFCGGRPLLEAVVGVRTLIE